MQTSKATTKATRNTPVARTPENVEINPQRMGFEFGDQVPRYWVAENHLISHTMNALSVLFPQGEQFFVDSVRHFRDIITDRQLKQEVRGFIGQEAMHSLEHMTAMMADMLLARDDVREDMHETMRPLWVWHAIEETEHKSVAYDVFQQAGGTYAERTFYLMFSTAALGVMASYCTTRMMLNDRKGVSLKGTVTGLWQLWGRNGTFSSLIPTWLEYFKPGFHPWDHDNSELIARFKSEIQQYIAPEYLNGNRRTLQ